MKKIIVISILLFSSLAYSEENAGTVVTLEKNEKAPFDGILLDKEAVAKILASDQIDKEKCDIDCQYKLDIQKAQSDLVVDNLKLSLEFEKEQQLKSVEYYEEKIQNLQDYKVEPPPDDDDLMWSLVGGSIGVIATSITFGIIMGVVD